MDLELRLLKRKYHAGLIDPDEYVSALERVLNITESPHLVEEDFEIQQALILSTAHISYSISTYLEVFALNDESSWVVIPHRNYGWWVYVPSQDEEWQRARQLFDSHIGGTEFWELLNLASSLNCQWLRIDQDGPIVDSLPTFEW